MPINNIFQHKFQIKAKDKLGCVFWLLIIAIILTQNLPNNSFAQNLDSPNIANKKEPDQQNNRNNDPLSKIISSLVKKEGDPSLMFSDDEIGKIEQALDAHKNNQPFIIKTIEIAKEEQKPEENEVNSSIYLDSILYHSPNNWSVWINGQKIASTDNKPSNEIYIKSISSSNVDIVWTMSISKWKILVNKTSEDGAPIGDNNQVEINFNLSFNQTYILTEARVIEGRFESLSKTEAWVQKGSDKP